MKTEIIKIDENNIDTDKLKCAADALRAGKLVAFPTETVYGLGANAMVESAVNSIFEAKGRPSDNPLIVHISKNESLFNLVVDMPTCAGILMKAFWPGPLTLVMKRSPQVLDVITAGLDTVAVRMPSNKIASALIELAGVPVAAPSANSSGKPSPTCSEHVIEDLFGKVDIIIDGGNVEVGLESTVLDITVDPPLILRPGGVTFEQLQYVIGNVKIDPSLITGKTLENTPKSPGMKYRHYAPKARVTIVEGELIHVVEEIKRLSKQYLGAGIKIGIISTDETYGSYNVGEKISLGSRNNPALIASNLFNTLRFF